MVCRIGDASATALADAHDAEQHGEHEAKDNRQGEPVRMWVALAHLQGSRGAYWSTGIVQTSRQAKQWNERNSRSGPRRGTVLANVIALPQAGQVGASCSG